MFAEIEHGILGLPSHFGGDLLAVLIFGAVGVLITTMGTKIFDWMYTKVDFEKEIAANNVAAAIVIGSVVIGLALIMCAVVRAVAGG